MGKISLDECSKNPYKSINIPNFHPPEAPMKRFILAILMLVFIFSLTGCGLFQEERRQPRTPSEFVGGPRVE